jgi:hypothetical protein
MGQRGRKRIEINWKVFEGLCAIQATLTELATFHHCSEDTIERAVKRNYGRPFAEVFAEKRRVGFLSLRRKIWETALDGNVTLLIFLAKHFLAMRDPLPAPPSPQAIREEQMKQDLDRMTDEELDEIDRIVNRARSRELSSPTATRQGKPRAAAPHDFYDAAQPHQAAGEAITLDPTPSPATSKAPGPANPTPIIPDAPPHPGPTTPAPGDSDNHQAKDPSI